MNISKESLPGNDSLQKLEIRNIHVLGSSASSSSPPSDQCSDQKLEDKSLQERRLAKMKNSIFKQKAHSYQDLHTDYTRRRYQHVKSKVKEYIASMKAYDHPKSNSIFRHRSLPETIGTLVDIQDASVDAKTEGCSDDIVLSLLQEKDKEMEELRRLNQHLEDNLQEKLTMLARLKLNADTMRIELLEMKDKQKRTFLSGKELRYSYHRGSLPVSVLPFDISDTNLKSTSTQTECDSNNESAQTESYVEEDNKDETEEGQLPKAFSAQTKGNCLRRRSLSNSMHHDAKNTQESSNSSNETEFQDECGNILDKGKYHDEADSFGGSRRRQKRSWRQCIAGRCKKVVLCCSQVPDMEKDFFYTKLPVDEIPML